MSVSNTTKGSGPAPRGHHELRARDLVVGVPEIGEPWLFVNVKRSLFPTRAKAKLTDATLIKRAERATGRRVCGNSYHEDGSRTVTVGGEAEQREAAKERARWREAINGWREAVNREKAHH
jgi:hypothetical protein